MDIKVKDDVCVFQSNDNMELMTKLQTEQHSMKDLLTKLAQQEDELKDIREAVSRNSGLPLVITKQWVTSGHYQTVVISTAQSLITPHYSTIWINSKTCLKRPLKNRQNLGLNGKW